MTVSLSLTRARARKHTHTHSLSPSLGNTNVVPERFEPTTVFNYKKKVQVHA